MLLREGVPSAQYPEKQAQARTGRAGIRGQIKFEKCAGSSNRLGTGYWVLTSINRLQFFPRLKPHRLAWRNRHLGSSARVASNAGLARAHVEHAKPSQLNA